MLLTRFHFICHTLKPTKKSHMSSIFVYYLSHIMLEYEVVTSLIAIPQECPTFRCKECRINILLPGTLMSIQHYFSFNPVIT